MLLTRSRAEGKAKAMEFLAAGNETAAEKFFQQGISVTSSMQRQFIDVGLILKYIVSQEITQCTMPYHNKASCSDELLSSTCTLLVQALVEEGVEFIVAPYEADAQMAYLAINGDVHAVISEDSDLLVYGCPRVREIMDQRTHMRC